MDDPKDILRRIIREAALKKYGADANGIEPHLERPKNPKHGDIACNIAFILARKQKRSPQEIAEELRQSTAQAVVRTALFEAPTAVGGFYNTKQTEKAKQSIVARVLNESLQFGRVKKATPDKVMVEFVSANPTGPLHVGHGRQAALGDALAALLEAQGHAVTREFYYNDAGAQIENLALSVQARARGIEPDGTGWPADGYAGDYIREIAEAFASQHGDLNDLEAVRKFAVVFLRREQDLDLQKFGVKFNIYPLESSMYSEGRVEAAV